MRALTVLLSLLALSGLRAQVELDQQLRVTASDAAERSVRGLAPAGSGDALLSVQDLRNATPFAATVIAGSDDRTWDLHMSPACTGYRNGLQIHFMPPAHLYGNVYLDVDGYGPLPIVRSDGAPPYVGELVPGLMTSVILWDGKFVITSRAPKSCPPDFVRVHGDRCIQRTPGPATTLQLAASACASIGARLCSWDEYITACSDRGAELEGLFQDWEWLDDTSDHTHTGVEAGRWTCLSQRSRTIVPPLTPVSSVRCCYTIR